MRAQLDLLRPQVLLFGWLAAAGSACATLWTTATAQGVGAAFGGCRWIGISLPVDRQVWALVDYPNLAFASQPGATPYWLASVVLPLFAAGVLLLLFQRLKSLAAELLTCQFGWSLAVIGGAFTPLLSRDDGHLERWLHFSGRPPELAWLAPVAALIVSSLAVIRLLGVGRVARPQAGPWVRIGIVLLHFVVPTAAWVVLANVVAQAVLLRSTVAVAVIFSAQLGLAWFRYSGAPLHGLREIPARSVVLVLLVALLLAAATWGVGYPRVGDQRSGLIWETPSAVNNIRQWIRPYAPFEKE